MPDKDADAPEMAERDWTFCYRWFDHANGKLYASWLDHHGEIRTYAAIPRGARPGTIWRVRSTEDATLASIKAAQYTGRESGNPERSEWAIADRVATTAKQREAELRKLADVDALDSMTLAEARTAIAARKGYTHRAAYLAVVLERLGIGWS